MLAKEHLLASDKYLKKSLFDDARQEIKEAKKIDPSNPYIPACEERLRFFEEASIKQNPNTNASSMLATSECKRCGGCGTSRIPDR